uniref:Uncharacterized protein n=1 Tax=viral metagenome TaxID=1070528 RepID=A0A6M3LN95_9ZZZZ
MWELKNSIIYIFALVSIFLSDPVASGVEPGIASRKDIAAMKYHGVLISVEDETGAWFNRGGRCRLFTEQFIERWETRGWQ